MTSAAAAIPSHPAAPQSWGNTAELWRSVLSGEWTVTERRDENGRATFVARPAEANERPTRRRAARDEEIGRLVARGWSNKQIAYELGVAPSTVTADLQLLLTRLHLRSRFELAAILSALNPPRI